MDRRVITFVCSHCGASPLTTEALRAHLESVHGGAEPAVPDDLTRSTQSIPKDLSGMAREQARTAIPSPETREQECSRLGYLPALALVASLGFALIVVAYAAARSGHAWAPYCYWAGEAIMFLPIAARVALSRRLSEGEAVGLVLVATLLQYLVKSAYSPLRFSFPDEIAHWQTAVDIVRTHHLFHVNYALPISPYYPGLELITSALSSMGGLSVFRAGIVVAGIAHLLLIVTLYAVGKAATGSVKLAALACIIYQTNPHYQFFDAYFIYLGVAMPLLLLALLVVTADSGMTVQRACGVKRQPIRWVLTIVYICAVMTVVVSHHVTALVLACVVALLAMFRLGAPRLSEISPIPTTGRVRMVGTAIVAVALAGSWMAFAASETFRYLSPAVSDFAQGLFSLFFHAEVRPSSSSGSGPLMDQLLKYAMTALIAIAIPFGAWRIAREKRSALAVFLGLLAFSYYAVILVRLISADGAEWAGRAFTYVYIPVSLALAVVIARAREYRLPAWASRGLPVAFLAILFFGGLVSGWPPYWERLPGGYQVSGVELSVSAPDLAVAQWFGQNLPPGGHVAADAVDYTLVQTIGGQNGVKNAGPLFYATGFLTTDRALVQQSGIRFVVVDQRLADGPPASGRYFPDELEYPGRAPLPLVSLEKFNRIEGISRVYDNGDIRVYDLAGSPYSP